DVLFTWNGTTSGVRVPDGDWIAEDRAGLSFADATSAVFAYDLPWDRIDVATFSWQKVLGGEGGHGVLILGPRAVERLESHTPAWPLPKLFRLMAKGALSEGVFKGETINTPSMLAVEDAIWALEWAVMEGGPNAVLARAAARAVPPRTPELGPRNRAARRPAPHHKRPRETNQCPEYSSPTRWTPKPPKPSAPMGSRSTRSPASPRTN